jgi:serine/threonine-protein kinase
LPRVGARENTALELGIGKTVGGTDWVLEGTLGRGGMAVVLAVTKPLAGIRGAMKVPHAELLVQGDFAARFLEEAKLYTSLKHPHIVSVIDCGRLEGGTPFMVMERLRGRTLRAVLEKARGGRRALRPSTAYEIMTALCDALHRLHSHRPVAVVHRDVKPENIFIHEVEGVAGRGTVKLLDLGLAGEAGLRRKVTMGTPRYMAPEQIRGDQASEHSDQYAAAIVLYEMLSGTWPWNVDVTDLEATVQAHLQERPRPLSEVCPWMPRRVNDAVASALAKDPAERLPSILHFLDAVRELDRARDTFDQDDAAVIATTAPTLGALAAYDTGSARVTTTSSSSPIAEAKPAAHEGLRTPDGTESSHTPDVPEISSVLESVRRSSREVLAARPTAPATRRPSLFRWAGVGLGFCLGVAAALIPIGVRSFEARQPPREPHDPGENPPVGGASPGWPAALSTAAEAERSVPAIVAGTSLAMMPLPTGSPSALLAAPSATSHVAPPAERSPRLPTKTVKKAPAAPDDGREFFEAP